MPSLVPHHLLPHHLLPHHWKVLSSNPCIFKETANNYQANNFKNKSFYNY